MLYLQQGQLYIEKYLLFAKLKLVRLHKFSRFNKNDYVTR